MDVACPTCKKLVKWDVNNEFRPFCCERCKLIDLGSWADGSYAVPGANADLDQLLPENYDPEHED